jgi:tetratricopeptide (TPR) repeat protein
MKRSLPVLLAACSTALAVPVPFRAWSDARPLPSEASFATKLPSFAACGSADFDRSKLSPDVLTGYDNLTKLVASLKADDPLRATMEKTLEQMRGQLVKAAPATAPTIPTSLAAAVGNAQTWLEKNEARGWQAFTASPDAKSARNASQAALAAAMLGKPSAALAALLTAHKLDPHNPETLANLGGVLETLGLPGEALVVLDAAMKLARSDVGAFGWSNTATLNTNRGLALADLRRWHEAEAALSSALQGAPMLAEARLGMARVLTCQGKVAQAARYARTGQRRTPPAPPAVKPPAGAPGDADGVSEIASGKDTDAVAHLPASFTFDLSRGKDFALPNLKLPQTLKDAVVLYDKYEKLHADLHARWEAIRKRSEEVEAQLRRQPGGSPVVQARREALRQASLHLNDEPTVKPLYEAQVKSSLAVTKVDADFSHCSGGCIADDFIRKARTPEELEALCHAAMSTQNDRWRSAMHSHAQNLGAYLKAAYRLETALAANYSDPLWHERLSLNAEFLATTEFMGYVSDALHWAHDIKAFSCYESPTTDTSDPIAGELVTPRADPCKAVYDGMSLSFSVSVVGFSISCDAMSVSAATPGWIGAFGSFSQSFGSKEYTVTVGIQEGVSVGVGSVSAGATSQQGAYVSWGKDGVTDAGVSITTGAAVGATRGSVGGSKDLITDVTGALSGKWSFIASPGGVK